MGPRLLACAVLAAFLSLSLATPAAARLSLVRRFAEEEDDDSWAVRMFSQRARPVYHHHGDQDADVDAAAEESVRQVEVQAAQWSTPRSRYLPTPSARRKDAAKHGGKSTPGPKYLPTPATTAYTDADDVTKVTRQETTWYTVTSSHVRSSTTKSDVSRTVTRPGADSSTQEISNDVRPKPSHRRGRVRYRSSVSESRTRNTSASRASRKRTAHSTTASSVDDKIATPETGFGRVQTAGSKRVTISMASATTPNPHNDKTSTVKPVTQNASTSAHKSAVASSSAKKSKHDATVRNVGTLETQQIPASFWKSLREELLNAATEGGPEAKKEVRETKDASSTEGTGTGGKQVKAKVSAEASGSSTKSCSRSGGEERGNHTASSSRRKANETAKAPAAPCAAVTKAADHASSKSAAVTTAKSSQSTAGRQSSGKEASTPSSGGTTPIPRETSTSTPEKKQQGSGSRTDPPKQETSTKKAEPVTDAKRSPEATSAAAGGQQKATPAAS